jgi:hypothetical protein
MVSVNRPNQAMQRTASQPAIFFLREAIIGVMSLFLSCRSFDLLEGLDYALLLGQIQSEGKRSTDRKNKDMTPYSLFPTITIRQRTNTPARSRDTSKSKGLRSGLRPHLMAFAKNWRKKVSS